MPEGQEVDTQDLDSMDTTGSEAGAGGTTEDTDDRPLTPREIALAAIEEQVEAGREQEMTGVEPGGEPEPKPEPPAAVPDQDQPRMVTVKVDGVEKQVPESEVIASYQKQSFAQQTINDAKQQADEIRRQAEAELEQARNKGGEAVTDEATLERSRKILSAMLEEGDMDSAAEELAALIGSGRSTAAPDVDQVAERVRELNRQDDLGRDYQKAKTTFDSQFADINADPELAAICNKRFQEEIAAGKMPSEAAVTAGNATREWVNKLTGKTPAPEPVNDLNNRASRKSTIDNITPASGRMSSTVAAQDNDPKSVIAEMKKSRGQV